MGKKTKPWEEPKFNTPKAPTGEIKYYKPIPEKTGKPIPADQLPEAPKMEAAVGSDYADYLSLSDIKQMVGSITVANAKPYQPSWCDYNYYTYDPYYEQQKAKQIRQEGLRQLVEDFTGRYGRGLDPQTFGVYLAAFIEKEGYRYGYESSENENLRNEVKAQRYYYQVKKEEVHELRTKIMELEKQLAGMVPRMKPSPALSLNGRKFRDD